jgi:hypothetical protein
MDSDMDANCRTGDTCFAKIGRTKNQQFTRIVIDCHQMLTKCGLSAKIQQSITLSRVRWRAPNWA